MINFANYTDPDYGVLLPTALTLPALGLSEHGLRKFRPLLVEGVDFLKQPGNGSIERIFYSAAGLLKLANAAATPQAQQLVTALQPYLPQTPTPSLSPDPAAIIPTGCHAVQPYTVSPSDLDPYAPMQRSVKPSPANSYTARPTALVHHSVTPSSVTPPYRATENHSDPAAHIASQLVPHLAPAIAAQVGSQVSAALARLENRPKELTEAELLLEQQRISIEQFKAVQEMVVAAQQSSTDQTKTLLEAMPKPNVFVESQGFGDLIALMKSEGMQLLVGSVSFLFALVFMASLLLGSRDSTPAPAPMPYRVPPSTAPVPLAPTPYPPTSP
ncbi:hypothetical protein NDI45_20425 [Leptolyngbya sp. GB1-A1]|uniref:hypothetical protein n=1 Tax=Leptolyngbya sp. GB1-A1 TaxID=2933908 RepID=UPI00329A5987